MKGSCLLSIMLWVEPPRSEPWDIFVWHVYVFASGKQGPIFCLGTVASGKNEHVIACGLAYDILSFQLLKFTMGRGGNDRYILQINIKLNHCWSVDATSQKPPAFVGGNFSISYSQQTSYSSPVSTNYEVYRVSLILTSCRRYALWKTALISLVTRICVKFGSTADFGRCRVVRNTRSIGACYNEVRLCLILPTITKCISNIYGQTSSISHTI